MACSGRDDFSGSALRFLREHGCKLQDVLWGILAAAVLLLIQPISWWMQPAGGA